MPFAARLTDTHLCPMVTPTVPPCPHTGGPILGAGSPSVIIEGLPAARVSDLALCAAPAPDVLATGSVTVMIDGLPAVRVADLTAHGGVIMTGASTVLIGG